MSDDSAGGAAADDERWAEIRRLWRQGDLTQVEIARRTGLSIDKIRWRARREGWASKPRRAVVVATPNDPAPAATSESRARRVRLPAAIAALFGKLLEGPDADAAEQIGRTVAVRAGRACYLKLMQLEQRLKDGEVMTPPESERHTKELTAVIANLEKSLELFPGRRGKRDAKLPAISNAADVERLRHEIAERLERIQRERESRGGPEGPGGGGA